MAQLAADAERHRQRRRHRRPHGRGRDDARAAPRLDDRRRPRSSPRARPSSPTTAKAAAKAKADQALADLKAGKDWETVAKAVSTDATQGPGRRPRLHRRERGARPAVRGRADGRRRRTRPPRSSRAPTASTASGASPTSSRRPSTRPTRARSRSAGIDLADYREALRPRRPADQAERRDPRRVPRAGPPARGLRDLAAGGPERERPTARSASATSCTRPTTTRTAAAQVAEGDPAWAAAEADARRRLREAPGRSRRCSTRSRARRATRTPAATSGGKLPYFSTEDAVDPAFAAAIHEPGLEPGQLLEPVKSAFGWHVIQVMHFPTDVEWANTLKSRSTAARSRSPTRPATTPTRRTRSKGGDMGWVAQGPARPGARGGDLRGPGRQGQRPAQDRRRRGIPVPRERRADPRARRDPEGGPRELRVLDLVHRSRRTASTSPAIPRSAPPTPTSS